LTAVRKAGKCQALINAGEIPAFMIVEFPRATK
jgi:hypothetical protein